MVAKFSPLEREEGCKILLLGDRLVIDFLVF
jgi:hypothetical protein